MTVKELFKRVGITFARSSLTKAIPFGVGVFVGAGANYALTKFVGKAAVSALRMHEAAEASAAA